MQSNFVERKTLRFNPEPGFVHLLFMQSQEKLVLFLTNLHCNHCQCNLSQISNVIFFTELTSSSLFLIISSTLEFTLKSSSKCSVIILFTITLNRSFALTLDLKRSCHCYPAHNNTNSCRNISLILHSNSTSQSLPITPKTNWICKNICQYVLNS